MPQPKPYHTARGVEIYHGDCTEIVPALGREFDAVIADPPYGKVVSAAWDHEWTSRSGMLAAVPAWRDMIAGALRLNGTAWVFAWPTMAGRIEAAMSERLWLLAHVVWEKPCPQGQKTRKEALRAPMPVSERILMFEHLGTDARALSESGYDAACDALRGRVFEPVRAYLAAEVEAAGWSAAKLNAVWQAQRGTKGGMAGHWLTTSQWELPTRANYDWLRATINGGAPEGAYLRREYDYLRREYDDLRREYDDLRREYDDLRRYFDCRAGDQFSDVWRFAAPPPAQRCHPCQKPLDLIGYMIRLSVRPGGCVLDPFAGSGSTGVAAANLGRPAVLVEREERYCEAAALRLSQMGLFDGLCEGEGDSQCEAG
jgi:adenine-specific DNA-methyltransferase